MRLRVLGILMIGLLLAADEATKDDTVKKELKKLDGAWKVVSIENDGEKMPDDEAHKWVLIRKGDQYTVKVEENALEEGKTKIDPTKKPKEIDIMPSDGNDAG